MLLPHAVLRAAAWPIEAADSFAAEALAHAADAVLEGEQAAIDRRPAVLEALHTAIPRLGDRAGRRYALAVKRHIHATTEPLPTAPAEADVPPVVLDEADARRRLADARIEFDRLYERELEAQRGRLREMTRDPRFARALLVANRPVATSWFDELPRRPKRQRHLETTVFHYLMRACGRPTPSGLWAGVTTLTPQPASSGRSNLAISPCRARYLATVDLRPFILLLRALSRQQRYRQNRCLHLNPTLRPATDGGWRYEQQQGDERHWVRLPGQPLISLVLDAFAEKEGHLIAPLIDAIVELLPEPESVKGLLVRLVDWLIDRDVLRVDLHLPLSAPDAWSALSSMAEQLIEADAAVWQAAITRCRALCDRISQHLEDLSLVDLDDCLSAIQSTIGDLWRAAGLAGPPPGPLVHVDLRLPFSATWSPAGIAAAEDTVRALLDFHAADGGAEIFRRQQLSDVLAVLGTAPDYSLPALDVLDRLDWQVPPRPRLDGAVDASTEVADTLEFVLGQMSPSSQLGREAEAYRQRWLHFLEPLHRQHEVTVAACQPDACALPGFAGAVLLRLAGADEMWVGPARPEAGLFAARFAALLDPPAYAEMQEASTNCGHPNVRPIEIVGWDELNPNSALHPPLTDSTIDPHELRDVHLVGDPRRGLVWLRKASIPGLLAPIYSTGADIGYGDVCGRLLRVIAASYGWEFPSFQMPALQAERARWRHSPRQRLAQGQVLRPERWTIDRDAIVRISSARGSERYLVWRQEVQRLGAPDLVLVRAGPHEPELVLRTDSPLAVRCLFDTRAARAPWLELSELPGEAQRWPVRDAAGQHYLAEVAVSWFSPSYWAATSPLSESEELFDAV